MGTTLLKYEKFEKLMSKFDLWKCFRVIAWIDRFITNSKKKKVTSEIKQQRAWFIKRGTTKSC